MQATKSLVINPQAGLFVIPKRALQALSQWSPRSQVDGSASLSVVEARWRIKAGFHGLPSELVTKRKSRHTLCLLGKKGRSAAQGHSKMVTHLSRYTVWGEGGRSLLLN